MPSETSTVREALEPTKLWDHLVESCRQNNFKESSETFHGCRSKLEHYYISGTIKDNKQIVITYPAHDARNDNERGGEPIAAILKKVKNLQIGGTILVPICQVNRVCGFGPKRMHFTMLEIHRDNENNISATHHDSKGWLAKIMYVLRIYTLNPIKSAVRDAFQDEKVTFNHHESGKQGIFNNVDCGRFVIAEINQIMTSDNRNVGAVININEEKIVEVEKALQMFKDKKESKDQKASEDKKENFQENLKEESLDDFVIGLEDALREKASSNLDKREESFRKEFQERVKPQNGTKKSEQQL